MTEPEGNIPEGFFRAAALDEVRPNTPLGVTVEGERIALFNLDGAIHAILDRCAHQSFPLSKGRLEGKYVVCALHQWKFDVTSGANPGIPAADVRTFPVKVIDGVVYVNPARDDQ